MKTLDRRSDRRTPLDAYERTLTNGQLHIGHLPVYSQEIEGWTFRRCRCGFNLALTPSGKVWWLRTANVAVEITDMRYLLQALACQCWVHPRPGLSASEPVSTVPAPVAERPALAKVLIHRAIHRTSAGRSAVRGAFLARTHYCAWSRPDGERMSDYWRWDCTRCGCGEECIAAGDNGDGAGIFRNASRHLSMLVWPIENRPDDLFHIDPSLARRGTCGGGLAIVRHTNGRSWWMR